MINQQEPNNISHYIVCKNSHIVDDTHEENNVSTENESIGQSGNRVSAIFILNSICAIALQNKYCDLEEKSFSTAILPHKNVNFYFRVGF